MAKNENGPNSVFVRMKAAFGLFCRKRIKDLVFWCIIPVSYWRARRQCLEPNKVLFIEAKQLVMPDSFVQMYNHLSLVSKLEIEYFSLGHNRTSKWQTLKQNIRCAKNLAQSKYVFLNDASNLVSCVSLRPETKVVQLWHGCGAFKKWGMSTADLLFGGSVSDLKRHPYYRNLTLVTVSSDEVAWAYREAMVLNDSPDVVQATGISRTDVFFDKDWIDESYSAILGQIPQVKNKKIILYAPTFRGRVVEATSPDCLDISFMNSQLGDEYVLLIKHHPFVKSPPQIPADCSDFAFDVSRSLAIDKLLSVADVCISDYSSLVFEYSLFERPMVFFAYDKSDYDDWRGFYYNYDELTPGPVVATTEEIVDFILNLETQFDKQSVINFKNRFMSACDGNSTKRIVERVFDQADLRTTEDLSLSDVWGASSQTFDSAKKTFQAMQLNNLSKLVSLFLSTMVCLI